MHLEIRMSVRCALIPLALALFAAGCTDERHPTAAAPPDGSAPHLLRWAFPPQFSVAGTGQFSVVGSGATSRVPTGVQASLSGGLSLDRYTASFWAVRGQPRAVQINYRSFTGDTSSPFLQFTNVDPAYVPGVGALAPGDSVLITVAVDSVNIKVTFEPTGLLFDTPAQLLISYGGAGGDLNGDGVVDQTDAYIEAQLLGMWYREGTDALWSKIDASQSIDTKSFTVALYHFSEYAVSW
jgi:hypothetical protein